MSCGVNIPLTDIVNAIVDGYADVFAAEVIKRMDLSRFVQVVNGEAVRLTLRQGVTLDEATKADLCSALSGCLDEQVEQAETRLLENLLGRLNGLIAERLLEMDIGNEVVGFSVVGDNLTLRNKNGSTFTIHKDELVRLLGEQGGITGATLDGSTLTITNPDGSRILVDLSRLGGNAVVDGEIELSSSTGRIKLIKRDGTTTVLNLDGLVSRVKALEDELNALKEKKCEILDIGVGDGIEAVKSVTVPSTEYTPKLGKPLYVTISTQTGTANVSLQRVSPAAEQGASITVFKQTANTPTMLVVGSGVTLYPSVDKIAPLTRVGDSFTLISQGNNIWHYYGPLK